MRYKLCVFFCLFSFLFGSCDLFDDHGEKPPPPEKKYKAKILWTREFFSDDDFPVPLIEGQYCYFTATGSRSASRINKIDLETGKVIWESERILFTRYDIADPQKIGAYVYLATNSGFVLVFDDSNGRLAATVMLGEDETAAAQAAAITWVYRERASCITALNPYLFWGNDPGSSASPKGLMRLDSREIDFNKEPDEVQSIIPELVWSKESRPSVSVNLFSDDGIIFFLTDSDIYNNPRFVSILTAMDAHTGAIIWERDMTQFRGILPSLVLNGNKIHVIDKSNSCYDKNTGDLLYHNKNETVATSREIALYNNFLYYLANVVNYPYPSEEVELEIVSLNAETGKKEWQAYTMYDSVISSPFVNAGKLYILNDKGLRVYNTQINDRSNFIGVDSFFKKYYCQCGFIYKDKLFLFVNESGTSEPMYLIAIQCE